MSAEPHPLPFEDQEDGSGAPSTRRTAPEGQFRRCPECEKRFPVNPSRPNKVHCDDVCRARASDRRKRERAERPSFRQIGPLVCSWCFRQYRPEETRSGPTYCGIQCVLDATDAGPKEARKRREEARKRMGLSTAAENNRAQCAIARWAALLAFRDRARALVDARPDRYNLVEESIGIASDVRDFCEERGILLEWSKSWTGSLFSRSEWFEPSGNPPRAATHKGSSARKVSEWRISDEGWFVLNEFARVAAAARYAIPPI